MFRLPKTGYMEIKLTKSSRLPPRQGQPKLPWITKRIRNRLNRKKPKKLLSRRQMARAGPQVQILMSALVIFKGQPGHALKSQINC